MFHKLKAYLKVIPVVGIFVLTGFIFSNNCGKCGKGNKRTSSEAKFEKLTLKKIDTGCKRRRG